MKKLFLVLSVLLISCNNDRVEQRIKSDDYLLTDESTMLVTYVWVRDIIIDAKYDGISTVTDSLVLARKERANRLLIKFSKIKDNIE